MKSEKCRGGLPERAEAHHSWLPIVIYNRTIVILVGLIAGKCAECTCN